MEFRTLQSKDFTSWTVFPIPEYIFWSFFFIMVKYTQDKTDHFNCFLSTEYSVIGYLHYCDTIVPIHGQN